MKGKGKSRRHLVPVVKSVIDPTKGLINRTYHVRPEELKTTLRGEKDQQIETFALKKIDNLSNIRKTVSTGDATHLKKVFPKKSTTWGNVLSRHNNFDKVVSHKEQRSKFLQNIYAFTLAGTDVSKNSLKTSMAKSSTIAQSSVNTSYSTAATRVIEATDFEDAEITPFTIVDNFDFDIEDIPNIEATELNTLYKQDVDYGQKAVFTQTRQQIPDGKNLALEMSKFIAFINPQAKKVSAIVSEFIDVGSLKDTTHVSQNLILPQHMYLKDSSFWATLLSKFVVDGYDSPENISSSAILYNMLILSRIDVARFKDIHNSYIDEKLDYVFSKKGTFSDILKEDQLSFIDKLYVIASLSKNHVSSIMGEVTEIIDDLFDNEDFDKAIDLTAALTSTMPQEEAYAFIKKLDPDFFDNEHMIDITEQIQLTNDKISIRYILTQIAIAKSLNLHYVPYNIIRRLRTNVFSAALLQKLMYPFIREEANALMSGNKRYTDYVDIYVRLPDTTRADNQLFVKIEPLSFHSSSTIKNSYKVQVPGESIFRINDGSVGVLNLIKYI